MHEALSYPEALNACLEKMSREEWYTSVLLVITLDSIPGDGMAYVSQVCTILRSLSIVQA
jgi:hypothetical protein